MKKIAGFTLIELLVTIGIIVLVTGGGIAGFINFNDKQQVTTAVKDIQTMMRAAQIKARAGEGAEACPLQATLTNGKLRGYEVALSGNNLIMNSVCADLSTTVKIPRTASTISLDGVSVTFDNASNAVEFLSLKGGTNTGHTGATPLVVTISGNAGLYEYTFEVKPGGEITEGAFTP